MSSDNISNIKPSNVFLKVILLPGMIWQWLLYVGVIEGKGSYSSVRYRTRISRSPFMTWLFSIVFWSVIVYVGHIYLQDHSFGSLINLDK